MFWHEYSYCVLLALICFCIDYAVPNVNKLNNNYCVYIRYCVQLSTEFHYQSQPAASIEEVDRHEQYSLEIPAHPGKASFFKGTCTCTSSNMVLLFWPYWKNWTPVFFVVFLL